MATPISEDLIVRVLQCHKSTKPPVKEELEEDERWTHDNEGLEVVLSSGKLPSKSN
jgi:hypothetical protein